MELPTFAFMSSLIPSSYFNGTVDVNQLDESILDQHIRMAPFDASLRLLAALKSGNANKGQSMLYSRERTFLTKMFEKKDSENTLGIVYTEVPEFSNLEVKDIDSVSTVNVDEQQPVLHHDAITEDALSDENHSGMDPKPKADKKKKKSEPKKQKQKKPFQLHEYGGISPFAQWLVSFKVDDLDKRLKKEAKKEKKRKLEENAKKSVTRSSSTISEPLAEILRMQGHLEDAKKMYGQLMQKFPEKSSYFAAKIEEINKVK